MTASSTSPARARRFKLAPLGALAAGFGLVHGLASAQAVAPAEAASTPQPAASAAQPAPIDTTPTLPPVTAKAEAERQGKDAYQATSTSAAKGNQALKDIPQSVTVVTEKLMDDRNLDTLKAALHSVTGIAFEAGEGGAIGDLIRLRGFSTRGDIFQDGMRDTAQYNRDTFNQDRIEVLRGSASMLYGRGSTGGIINQVSKQPFLVNENVVDFTAGTDDYYRLVGDFNLKTGDDAALRVNVMKTKADSARNGPSTDRTGIAPTYRFGIGTSDEFSLGFYHLDYHDVPDYGFGWANYRPVDAAADRWYGFASDYQKDSANQIAGSWLHRFAGGGELKTSVRNGHYVRDLWSTTARLQPINAENATSCNTPFVAGSTTTRQSAVFAPITDASVICRGNQTRAGEDHHRFVQTDYTGAVSAFGVQHELLAGAEYAREASQTFVYSGTPAKANTVWGRPGPYPALVDTRLRVPQNQFDATTLGAYVQDTINLTARWKLIAGLRFDHFDGDYQRAAGGPLARTDSMWSRRFGVIYQPTAQTSWYAAYGTSFNPSGDLYQFDPATANTPPEKSRNIEAGVKWDAPDNNLSARAAVFRSEKYNERNTDLVDASTQSYLLSGKRHTDGIELEAAGRPLQSVEVFGGVAYMRGRIDAPGSATNAAASVGKETGLTPRWTGNLWATWQIAPKWRVGLGADGMASRVPALAESGDASGIVNRAPGYVKADALIEYAEAHYKLKLNLINLTDTVYTDGVYRGFTVAGPGRGAQLTVSATF